MLPYFNITRPKIIINHFRLFCRANEMECLIGITGKDFVVLASDTNHFSSIIVLKSGN